MDSKRLFDVSTGVRLENTSRTEGAQVDLSSMLFDFGVAAEVVKKFDLLAGLKYFAASGNEYMATRDGFNLVTDFTAYDIDVNETIFSIGARIRFSEQQAFSLNYNMAQFEDNLSENSALSVGQIFFNYTGKF